MSLRSRLLVGMAVVALVLVGASLAVARTTRAHLVAQVDRQLVGAGPPLRGFDQDRRGGGPGQGPGGQEPIPLDRDRFSSLYAAVVEADGTMRTVFTPNLTSETPPLPDISAEQAQAAAETGRAFTVRSEGSSLRYRARADQFGPRVLVVALPLADVDAAIRRLITVEVVATAAILAVLGVVTSWVIRLGVKPIKRMTATATAIAGGDLSHRVPDVAPGTEAGELGIALNQMMGHIEAAFDERARSQDRLRQFVADASHELRTPVTTIRGYAELHRAGGLAEPGELAEAMRRTEQEAVRMGSLIDDLLLLARLDQGRPLEREPVDLSALAADAARDARAVDPERRVTVDTDGEIRVTGDDGRLRQVVGNLVGNALVHTPPGTPIDVRTRREGDRAVLEVHDTGPGMEPTVAERAFERFFRADPGRSRHRGGSGLGLAIVQATVSAHGGAVALETEAGKGTTVRVELPLG